MMEEQIVDFSGLYSRLDTVSEKLDTVISCLQVSNSLTLFCLAVVASVFVCYVLWRLIKNFL